jgi:hypothetical protein
MTAWQSSKPPLTLSQHNWWKAKLTPHRPLYSWWNDRGGPPKVLVLDQKAVEEGDSWPRDRETELIAAHVSKSLLNYHNRPKPPKRVIVKYWGTPCVRGHVVDGKTQRYAKNDSCVCCALERRAGKHNSDMRCVGWNASRTVAVS